MHFKLDQPDTGGDIAPPSPLGGKHLCAAVERARPGGQVPWQQLGAIFSQDFGGFCEILGTWGFEGDRPSQQLHRLVQMDLAREDPLGMLKAIHDRVVTGADGGAVEGGRRTLAPRGAGAMQRRSLVRRTRSSEPFASPVCRTRFLAEALLAIFNQSISSIRNGWIYIREGAVRQGLGAI